MKIRTAAIEDIPQIYQLWETVFGDGEDFLDLYFGKYAQPERILTAEKDGRIFSMCSSYAHDALVIDGKDMGKCPAAFAGATYEEDRGGGVGLSLIHRQLLDGSSGEGEGISMLAPAEESLFDLYQNKFGCRDFFYYRKLMFRPQDLSAAHKTGRGLRALTPAAYQERRETLLKDVPHLRFTLRQIEMEAEICALDGGGLFAAASDSGEGICAVERISEEMVRVNELLIAPSQVGPAMLEIARLFAAEQYEIRLLPSADPAAVNQSAACCPGIVTSFGLQHAGMILSDRTDLPDAAYAGFVFD